MFKIYKLNNEDGIGYQLRFLNLPIFQYQKNLNKKIKVKIPILRRYKLKQPVFYLKYNTHTSYSLWCLHRWIEAIRNINGDFYIICDNPILEQKIIQETTFKNLKFIKSDRKTFKSIINIICDKCWLNAGFAHLTTFTHAYKNGINNFWNIDADDTTFFGESQEIAKALKDIMQYAETNDIDVFSYDMHATRFYNKHWSFGITYTRNNEKIIKAIRSAKTKEWRKEFSDLIDIFANYNLDWFFTYLRNNNMINAKTYDIDNVYFAHWGFGTPTAIARILQISNNGQLNFPFANSLPGLDELYTIPLKDEIVVFNNIFNEVTSRKMVVDMLNGFENSIKSHTDK